MFKQLPKIVCVVLFLQLFSFLSVAAYSVDKQSGLNFQVHEGDTTAAIIAPFFGHYEFIDLDIPSTVSDTDGVYTVTEIGEDAFNGCNALTNVSIPATVSVIAARAFMDCATIDVFELKGGLTSIGDLAFAGTFIQTLKLGEHVTGIQGLSVAPSVIVSLAKLPPVCDERTFLSYDALVHVPNDVGYIYCSTKFWHEFFTPDSVVLDSHYNELDIDETLLLEAKVHARNVFHMPVEWSSSDTSVAVVDENGEVTALAAGECSIIATCEMIADTCQVLVHPMQVASVLFDQHETNIHLKKAIRLTPVVDSSTPIDLIATSSDTNVVKVQLIDGIIEANAVGLGSAFIQIKADSILSNVDTCDVKVFTDLGDVDADGGVSIGDVTVLIDYLLGSAVTIAHDYADMNFDGSVGIADVTYVIERLLIGVPADSVVLNYHEASIEKGRTFALEATAYPSEISQSSISWESTNNSIATVKNGMVTAVTNGECDIVAHCQDKADTCHVSVYEIYPVEIVMSMDSARIEMGHQVTLTANVYPDNVTDPTIEWNTTDESVANVEDGVVMAIGAGECDIVAQCHDKIDSCHVVVYEVYPESVQLSMNNARIEIGSQVTLTAGVYPENVTNPAIVWSSTKESVASVNDGVVKALAAGECDIVARCQDKTDTCHVVVCEVYPQAVYLSMNNARIEIGSQVTLTADVYPQNVTNPAIVWSSTKESVASVINGVVKALAAGECDIVARCQDKTDTCHVVVYEILPESVQLSVHNASLKKGEQLMLTAGVYPENVTNPTIVWSSSKESVASVTDGLVTALAAGECDIIARCQDKTDVCHVVVTESASLDSITLNETKLNLAPGKTFTLEATLHPAVFASTATISWQSTNTSVATVNGGLVKAVSYGECDIIASCQDKQAVCHVTVADGDVFTVNGVTFRMIEVEGGTFTMGAPKSEPGSQTTEKPQHQVTLSTYKIAQTEVTQELWQAVMGTNPSHFKGDLQRPVETVRWTDCMEFIEKLNELTGQHFRLPTEAEWEYAAMGGKKTHNYMFAGGSTISEVGWFKVNSDLTTHPVAQKTPNELGIYDMCGNVSEWCSNWYEAYTDQPQTNPTGPATGENKIYRDGNWSFGAAQCRVHFRYSQRYQYGFNYLGFRLAM